MNSSSTLKEKLISECRLTGSFKTRSGQIVSTYFDKYQFEGNPHLLSAIASELSRMVPAEVEILAGLEMGGIPLATAVSLETGLPVCFVRKNAKPHGTQTIAEGPSPKGKKVLIIEDVTTTGGQIILSANDLMKIGADIVGVMLVIARSNKALEALNEADLPLYAYMLPEDVSKYMD
ncbi:MAG: orotate phosphoribosyltransferase [Pseudomonadota bacterium]